MEKRILKRMGKMMYGEKKKKKKINTREKKKKKKKKTKEKKKKKDLEIGSLLFKGLFCFKKIERKKKKAIIMFNYE